MKVDVEIQELFDKHNLLIRHILKSLGITVDVITIEELDKIADVIENFMNDYVELKIWMKEKEE